MGEPVPQKGPPTEPVPTKETRPGADKVQDETERAGRLRRRVISLRRLRGVKTLRRPQMIAVLPTLLTLGNVVCGFGAITFAAKLGPETTVGNALLVSSILVFMAMLFDALDGSAARWTKQTSELGAQLDSLCDAISFGVAPAFLMLQSVKFAWEDLDQMGAALRFPPRLLWTIAVLYVVCAVLRLARFNVETEEDDSHSHFSGLPSPAAAATVVSFPITLQVLFHLVGSETSSTARSITVWLVPTVKLGLPLITFAVACLMVSRFRYAHMFNQIFRGRLSGRRMIQFVFLLAVIYWLHELVILALPAICCVFAFGAPIKSAWRRLLGGKPPATPARKE